MKAIFKIGLLLLCLGMGIWTIAQGNTDTYEFPESDVSISFPTKWTLTESDDGFIELSSSGLSLTVYDNVALASIAALDDIDAVEDALHELAIQIIDETDYDENDVTVYTIDERDIARLDIELDDISGLIVVTMADQSYGLIQISNSQSNLSTIETLLNDIIASFDAPANNSASESISCTISTTQSSTVQVRVGPGTNRTVVSFLPANRDFTVISKTVVNDGDLWFQLNKADAAPNKSVNQTWVAAESVDQAGNCDAVVDGLAPPIVPIVQAAPNSQPDSDSAVSSGTGTCYVSTTSANTVPVRHGPETRRSIAVFLPANTDYEVIAKTISADGSLWFELNKDEVSYGILANDLWVAATSVNQTGNCAGDGGTAPPLVPFIQHDTGGNDIYGDDRDDRAYFLLVPGNFVQESGDILVFCPDGTSYDISRPYRTELVYISTSGYQTGLVIDGQVYSPISPNYYGATHSINVDGEIVVARIKVTVSTQDWLSIAATYSIGSCEADLLMLLKRQ